MPSTAISTNTTPLLIPPVNRSRYPPERISMQCPVFNRTSKQIKLSVRGPVGLRLPVHHVDRRGRQSASIVCAAASNARCSMGQSQTVTREAPTITITKAPAHGKSPKLDDGGPVFPPGGSGGGGGGGGGGDSSGGWFLFSFLAFMGLLKDIEADYQDNKRR